MVLEPPSDVTLETKAAMEENALHAGAFDLKLVGPSTSAETLPKKKKGPKGPNPLSMKKKKAVEINTSSTKGKGTGMIVGEKRKRNESSDSLDTGEKRKGDDCRPSDTAHEVDETARPPPAKKRRRRKKVETLEPEED
ncbi:hypothetical protein C0991_000038 [Blastosporella zonata]|nr:hypothetical protein C0991_000038 [Blastosporella zonata]